MYIVYTNLLAPFCPKWLAPPDWVSAPRHLSPAMSADESLAWDNPSCPRQASVTSPREQAKVGTPILAPHNLQVYMHVQ